MFIGQADPYIPVAKKPKFLNYFDAVNC